MEKIQELQEEEIRDEQRIQLTHEKIKNEVEKEDFENIYNLHKVIKNEKIKNITGLVKKIILSYIANVSENVQFQLKDEIKEIYKSLKNIHDDL